MSNDNLLNFITLAGSIIDQFFDESNTPLVSGTLPVSGTFPVSETIINSEISIEDYCINRYFDIGRHYSNRYSDENYDLASIYFIELRENWLSNYSDETLQRYNLNRYNLEVNIYIKNILLDMFIRDEKFPTVEELIEEVYSLRCNCVIRFSLSIQLTLIKKIYEDHIMLFGTMFSCSEIEDLLEYYLLNNQMPTQEEMYDFLVRQREFYNSPEEFHQKDKQFVPTLNIDKLPTYTYKKIDENDYTCGMCQDDFKDSQTIIKLIPCNHEFHLNPSECLENACILNWMNNHNLCPICRTKININ